MAVFENSARSSQSGASERRGEAPANQDSNTRGARADSRFAVFVSLIQHGESVAAATRRSGLSADQVLQWLEDDPSVVAELEATRQMINKQIYFRLIALAHKAVDTVDRALDDGDGRVAVEVLTGLGLLGGETSNRSD